MEFGARLHFFRQQTIDPKTKKSLTQQRLGELLGEEMEDYGFTGAAISDWERNESIINVNDRSVLLGLVSILKKYGGIKTLIDANTFLEEGNYRALNLQEREKLFPGESNESQEQSLSNIQSLFGNFGLISFSDYQAMREEAQKGPEPHWPRLGVSIIRRFTDNISVTRVLRGIIWVWIWLLAHYLISPSLNWRFTNADDLFFYMILYIVGTFIIPLFIGVLTNTKDNVYWVNQKIQNLTLLRLYVYQGAYIGFHVGYFLMIPISLIQVQLEMGTPPLLEAIKVTIPLLISYASAYLIPYNLWLAYKRLSLKDGWIFFTFALVGPFWAWFFLEFYDTLASPYLGIIMFLLSLTIAVIIQRKNTKRV